MKHALLSVVFGLFLAPTVAFADDMPTFKLLMKDGRLHPRNAGCTGRRSLPAGGEKRGAGATEFESLELKKELVLAPGVTRNLVFFPMKPGTYKFFDDFHPETGQGRIVAK
jgi:hypothetical protein